MLGEVAITPDVFRDSAYSAPSTAPVHLQYLKEPLLQEVLVRNLHDGNWYRSLIDAADSLCPRGKELLKKLYKQARLRNVPSHASQVPAVDAEWFKEALDSSGSESLDCIITSAATKAQFQNEALAADIEKIATHTWWTTTRSSSLSLSRTTQDYLKHLDLVLRHSNSLMFIDPHLDPKQPRYGEFWKLLKLCDRTCAPPLIEIHRACYIGSGRERKIPGREEWKKIFNDTLGQNLAGCSLKLKVFIWDDFHDRYLISNLIGIQLPYGFDVGIDVNNQTTWTRLGRDDRDKKQREFDPSGSPRTLRHEFEVTL